MTNRRDDDFAYAGPSRSGVTWAAGLVLVALLIGVVVLQAVDNSPKKGGGEAAASGDSAAPVESSLAPLDPLSTTTTVPPRLASSVRVIVTNGSGVNRAARRVNDALAPSGYAMVTPRDATRTNMADAVIYKDGFLAEANAIAASLGVTEILKDANEQLIKTPPAVPAFDVQVMVGPILARKYQPAGTAAPAAPAAAPAAVAPAAAPAPVA